jgi:hypothetical protein
MFRNKSILLISGCIILVLLVVFCLPGSKAQIKTAHFTFNFPKSIDTATVNKLATALEDNYQKIGNDLKTIPSPAIEVNLYAQRWRYIKATGNWGASGSIEGVSRLHFIQQAWGEADSKKVAIHEFAHAVTLKLLVDNESPVPDPKIFDKKFAAFPVWLWEAISVYEASQFVDPKSLSFFNNGSCPGIPELNNRSKGGKIYTTGYTIIEYILYRYGQDKLIELIKNYGNIPKVFGITGDEFCKDWCAFVKKKYLQ